MDGSRGFFSAAAGSTPTTGAPPGISNAGATRARPVSAGTRLRQKPANAAAHQDFFASLGIDNASRSRTGSSASTSSNRSYNSMTMRPASASAQGSSASSSSGWRPPPIGGLGSQRAPPPPPMPSVGSLSIAGINKNVMTTTTNSTTTSISGGRLNVTGVASTAVPAPPVPITASSSVKTSTTTSTTTTGSKPTQLFSMEDAEDLYSDDGWNCDSPSTVLSNPTDDAEAKPTTTPALAAAAAAAAEAPADEFAWGDDDDAFASPVAKTTAPPTQPPPLDISSATATQAPVASAFETNLETSMPPPSAPPAASWSNELETKSFNAAQMPVQEMKSPFEQAHIQSTPPPPAAVPPTSFSTQVTHTTFDTKSYTATQVPPQEARSAFEHAHVESPPRPATTSAAAFPAESTPGTFEAPAYTAPPVAASISNDTHQQDEQWDEDWAQHEETVAKGSRAVETSEVTSRSTIATTTITTTIQTDMFVKAPVELASPGGAAGEFWGDGDEDELFDHDDHADEEWDETIKDQTSSAQHMHGDSTASAFSGQDTSFSLPSQPLPPAVAESPPRQETLPVVAQETMTTSDYPASEATKISDQEEMASAPPVTPPKLQDETAQLYSAESSLEAKPATSLDAESSPFSNAIESSVSQDTDPNVFPEAPRNARFLHTPTGTGGPFGRVSSPQGNDSGFQDEFSGAATAASTTHNAEQTHHSSMAFTDGEKAEGQDSYEDSGVRWDAGSLHSGGHGQQHEGKSRQGQSDEEERDSVVSFSGENSFFPSAGRPSSLYGGSQSSFASHRMYQSSVASTDHEGSSIASFGVSSAGATFGGSERVSEGGAFSDGTMSETPSMVDSSNASTAFGTDFPSVSEGQFSAPGTTIGGSDNGSSDGGFSDGNASEATSMCESVSTNPRLVSEFNATRGHYVTETIERRDVQEPFASSAPESDSVAAFGVSEPAAASSMFGTNASADDNPFTSSPSAFNPAQHATRAPPAASNDSNFGHQAETATKEEGIQSAASLFGATAGADVPNPFSSFGAPPAAPAADTKPIEEHELPTSDAGDLFGSGPSTSAFGQPVQHASYQTHEQGYSDSGTSAFNSAQSQFASSPFDRPAAAVSSSSPFETQSSHNSADPFASRGGSTQHGFGNAAPSADSVFSSDIDRSASSHFGGGAQASADAVFGGYSRSDNNVACPFGQQSSAPSASYGGTQSYSQYAQSTAPSYQDSTGASNASDHYGGIRAQSAASSGQSYGHSSAFGAGSSAAGHFSRQSSTSSFTSNSASRETGRYSNQRSVPGTPDNYSQQSVTSAFANSPARPPQREHLSGSRQFGQGSTAGTPSKYNHHSAAEVFGSASPARPHYEQNAARGLGGHTRSSSGASADAFFGRSSVSSGSVYQQPPAQTHAQPSFSRSASNASSYAEQQGAHGSATATAMRSTTQSHDLNTSFGSVDNVSLSRQASSSSMSRYESDTSFQLQKNMQHREEPAVDANSFFGGTSATEATASSFFGSASQGSSEMHTTQHQDSSLPGAQPAQEFAPAPEQMQEQQQMYPEADHAGSEYVGASTAAPAAPVTEASLTADVTATSGVPAMPSDMGQHDASNAGQYPSTATDVNAGYSSTSAVEQEASPFANDQDGSQPQAFDGFAGSAPQEFGGQRSSSNFFSSSAPTQAEARDSSNQFEQTGYHQQEQTHGAAAAGMQFAETHSSYQHTSAGTDTSYAAHTGSYFDSSAPGVGSSSPANYRQQQVQQPHQQYQQYQQQQPQHHDATGYGYHGGAGQSRASGYNAASQHDYGAAVGHGYGATNAHHASHAAATPIVKTSNKYKDPCVAPPSCLASFGFGGNVVTMFPKRKLRLNIAGSGFRNSPRGPAPPSAFDNGGNCELRKGPVNLYRMDQLHPKDKEFEQMDIFPGPLTENVSDEAILEYLDDRLKRSEAPTSADEDEDENDRLLLGILRVLVKCNGKLRSDPGTLNPSDPDSPEAQLITLLSESSKRRSGNQPPTFPPRKIQSAMHPDLMLKHANELRELLLVGDRKGAVSTAMSAHMWPEAMLIASFTDKEEYRRVLRTYLDETYAMGDPSRALFMAFADQQEKSVQEPKRLLQTNIQQSSDSLVLSAWVSHAQVLLANRTADTNKILTELGDRLWTEVNAVAAAHVCYLLAGIQVEAPMPTSKIALLGGDHRTSTEARFYVSPGAVQRTEVYEWAQKQAKGASANLMIPFQGYKLIYAMLLADHGKLETAFKYVTSMLTVIKAVTATMKPGTSMYLEGMKNQLTVLDDRLRQHLGQDRVASVAASTSRGGSRKQGKWGLGSALSIMGKIVNRVVEGNDSSTAAPSGSSASPGGLYANEATPPAASYPTPSVPTSTLSPAPSYPQQLAQQTPPQAHMTPPPSSHGPIPSYIHATPPGSAPGSSNGYNRTSASPAGPYSRQGSSNIPPSGPFSGNGRPGPQQSGPFSGNGRPGSAGPASQKHGTVPLMRSQHSMEPPGSNRSTHSNSSFHGMPSTAPQPMHQQPPSSQTSQHSQETPTARPALQKPAPLNLSGDTSSSSQPKTLASGLAAEVAASLPPTDAATMSGPSSDKGKASPKFKAKKSGRSKTPPPSGSSKSSGWLSGLSSFIATKMNPEAKVAKLGEQMEAYFDEETKRWIFPGEAAAEEPAMPSAPPTGPMPASAPGSGVGVPPVGSTNSAPGSMTGGPTPSNDPLAALMAPPPSHVLMKKDPLAAMMAPPSRPGMYGARRGGSTAQHKPPRPQFAVFKPSAAPAPTPDEPSE
ncbi:hypothetical protein L917_01189 [Phytophthora nicotianae]|uniref:Protein transport protein sec16 n=1 Tax=Phytophthora nicotianae TaxID=4792 RepID=W2LXU6_PHYNI|nr:hypothetical protein L917_01189 [Phytophthora nicotianae]